jgi:hypothetical protein
VLDYRNYLGALRNAGFDGPVVAHSLSVSEATGVGQFLRQMLAEAG